MPTYPDRSSSLSLDPISCRLVSPLQCTVPTGHLRHSSPTAHFSVPLSHSLTGVPSPLLVTSRSRVQNPLSGFAPKQTKESSALRTTYIVLHINICILQIYVFSGLLCCGRKRPKVKKFINVVDKKLTMCVCKRVWEWKHILVECTFKCWLNVVCKWLHKKISREIDSYLTFGTTMNVDFWMCELTAALAMKWNLGRCLNVDVAASVSSLLWSFVELRYILFADRVLLRVELSHVQLSVSVCRVLASSVVWVATESLNK